MKIDKIKIETILADQGKTKTELSTVCQNVSTIINRGTCEPKTAGKLAAGLGVPVSEIIKED